MHRLLGTSILLLLISMIVSNAVLAEEQLYCAAIYPCTPDGVVQAPYDTGDCADYYRAVCHSKLVNLVGDELTRCEGKRDDLVEVNLELEKRVKKLRRRLRRIRRD